MLFAIARSPKPPLPSRRRGRYGFFWEAAGSCFAEAAGWCTFAEPGG
jgi:hypothetical protein